MPARLSQSVLAGAALIRHGVAQVVFGRPMSYVPSYYKIENELRWL